MGLGKPLKSITHPLRKHIPVFLGAEGPKNIALAAERCDGWLPIFVSPYRMDIFDQSLEPAEGRENFEIIANVNMYVNDDLSAALLPVKYMLALYLGGMGAKSDNFHKNLIGRMGFADEAQQVQDVFFEKGMDEAVKVVPDALADEISLCGSKGRIKERLSDWKKSRVTGITIGVSPYGEEATLDNMRTLVELMG